MAFDLNSIWTSVVGWFSGTGGFMGQVLGILLIVGIGGALGYWWYLKKIDSKLYIHKINLFKAVNGKDYFIRADVAKEFVVPGTNVRLFYWKNSKIYSAYPTRTMGYNIYAYKINRMGELVNFDFNDNPEDPTEAKIDYDHRDQTYAYLNLQEFIRRNYQQRDKVSWWKENIGLISNIIMITILGLALWYFMSKQGQFVDAYSVASQNFKDGSAIIADAVRQASHIGSGVVEAGA